MNKKTIWHISAFTLTSILILISGFISTFLNANDSILDNRICLQENSNGHCTDYKLPYKGHTFADYLNDLSEQMTTKDFQDMETIVKMYNAWFEKVISNMPRPKSKVMKLRTVKDRYRIAKLHIYLILQRLDLISKIEYPTLKPKELNLMAHDLYCLANGIHLNNTPNFHQLTQNTAVNFTYHTGKNQKTTNNVKPYPEIVWLKKNYHKWFVAKMIYAVQQHLGFTWHWRSLRLADWMIDHIPELKHEAVVELGAGNGYQARLLKLKGVDILATDIKLNKPHYTKVEKLKESKAVNEYADKKVFFVEFPGWYIFTTIQNLMNVPGLWTLVIVSDATDIANHLSTDHFSVKKYYDEKLLKPSLFKYSDNSKNRVLIIRKTKEFLPLSHRDHTEL